MKMRAVRKGERTVLQDCQFQGAFKVTRPVYEDGYPVVYCIHVGGGYVDGDRYLTEISLEEDAMLTVTTQAATKIYKTPKHPVTQQTELSLKKGGYLAFVPDPIIAYADARFLQETTIRMEKGARLLYSDIITPGWSEDRTHFSYDWIRSKVKVYVDGKLQLFDHVFLHPSEQALPTLLQMEGYTHFGSLLVIDSELQPPWLNKIKGLVDAHSDSLHGGISLLKEGGFVIRVLANQTQVIERLFQVCMDYIREKQGAPDISIRKY